jgi:hypothetical protein
MRPVPTAHIATSNPHVRRKRWFSASLLTLLFVSASSSAQDSDADELIRRGVSLRRERRDSEALDLFRRAYEAQHATRALAQIGLAEQALARWVVSEADIERALAETSDPWVAAHREGLERALTEVRRHLARLEVIADVDGAELWINGERAGVLPLGPLRVLSGRLTFQVRAPDRLPVQRDLDLPPSAESVERVMLPPMVAPTTLPQTVALTDATATPRSGVHPRTIAWAALAGGGVFLGGGLAANIYRNDRASTFNAHCPYGNQSINPGCAGWQRDTATAEAFAVAGYSLGAAASLAAGALLWTSKDGSTRIDRRALVLAGTIAGGVLLTGGVVAHVYRNAEASSFDAHCPNGAASADLRCGGWSSDVSTGAALAVLGYSVGGLTLLATGYGAWAGRTPGVNRGAAVKCTILATGGLECGGGF